MSDQSQPQDNTLRHTTVLDVDLNSTQFTNQSSPPTGFVVHVLTKMPISIFGGLHRDKGLDSAPCPGTRRKSYKICIHLIVMLIYIIISVTINYVVSIIQIMFLRILNINNKMSKSNIRFITIQNKSFLVHVCFVLLIVCFYICVCECLL